MFLKNFAVILAFTYLIEAHRPKYDANLVPLIVGGVEATPYEFPWIVSIQRPTHSCGGSIINENWILTAAHCSLGNPGIYTVIAGEHNFTAVEGPEQFSGVTEIIVHEGYDDLYLENDIALMKLRTPLVFNDKVQPALLPDPGFEAEGMLVVAGWGRLSFGGPLPGVLMKVDVPVISLNVCREVYPDDYPVFEHNICAGYLEGEKDSCNGDSGGPLMCEQTNGNGTTSLNLCGLVSWGGLGEGSCAYPNEPGVYTAVAFFGDWISRNINASRVVTF